MNDHILRNVPEIIETERLTLRAPRLGDGEIVFHAVEESRETLKVWMPWAVTEASIAASESFIRFSASMFMRREEFNFLIFEKSSGTLLGASSLHTIDWSVPRFEIGYWLRDSATGKGYMTEAVHALTRLAFETLDAERVEIRCDTRNEPSANVARRAGYTQEACLRRQSRGTQGELRDTYIFAKLRDEYFGLT